MRRGGTIAAGILQRHVLDAAGGQPVSVSPTNAIVMRSCTREDGGCAHAHLCVSDSVQRAVEICHRSGIFFRCRAVGRTRARTERQRPAPVAIESGVCWAGPLLDPAERESEHMHHLMNDQLEHPVDWLGVLPRCRGGLGHDGGHHVDVPQNRPSRCVGRACGAVGARGALVLLARPSVCECRRGRRNGPRRDQDDHVRSRDPR
mmetsp:Transcript_30838/g.94523  ORF Transcript_30838/g.94523 Transcript_30838/m.94523 type:complete len:204 (+) Transcript_30838:1497-2108(+)